MTRLLATAGALICAPAAYAVAIEARRAHREARLEHVPNAWEHSTTLNLNLNHT